MQEYDDFQSAIAIYILNKCNYSNAKALLRTLNQVKNMSILCRQQHFFSTFDSEKRQSVGKNKIS